MANETIGFRTSLFGFEKKDVLACIDRLSAESQKAEAAAKAQIEALHATPPPPPAENCALQKRVEENTGLMSQMAHQVKSEQDRAREAEAKTAECEEKNAALDGQNQEYKRRLFQSEEENVRLHHENDALQQQCSDKQAQLEKQTAQMGEVRAVCEKRMQEISTENEARLVRARQDAEERIRTAQQSAEQRVSTAKQEASQRVSYMQQQCEARQNAFTARPQQDCAMLRASADSVNHSLAEVKRDLTAAGENISRLSEELQSSMQMLEAALSEAEQQSLALSAAADAVQKPVHAAAAGRAAQPSAAQAAPAHTPGPVTASSVAERLLDKLAHLLEQ